MSAEFYTYQVRFSHEDQEFLATVAEFPSLSWLAESPDAALQGLRQVVTDVIQDMPATGEQPPEPFGLRHYSGKLNLRMTPSRHRELAIRAAQEDVSLNRYINSLLSA